jgi:very-short-patch-repair endonuclease
MIRPLQHLALKQGGAFSRSQAIAAGYTPGQISVRIRRGHWCQVLPRVYAAAGTPLGSLGHLWATHLSAGPSSVISHVTAAALWDLPVADDGLIHLTVPPDQRPRLSSPVRLHRLDIDNRDRAQVGCLPVTSRAATLLDCLPMLGRTDAITLLDRAIQQGWLKPVQLQRRLARAPGRHGNRALRRLLAVVQPGAHSAAERALHRLLNRNGVTGWRPQHAVRLPSGRIAVLDVAFPLQRIAVEVDGHAWHSDPERFQRDRSRQNELVTAGWTVLRFTWSDLTERSDVVLGILRNALSRAA